MSQQTPIARVDTESHYARFRQGLATKLPVLASTAKESVVWGSEVFQFSSRPVPVNWENERDFNAYLIGSRNSTAPGPFYTPSSDLHASYKAYLASIDDAVPDDETLTNLRQSLHTQHLALSDARNSLSQAFDKWRIENPQEHQNEPLAHHNDCYSWGRDSRDKSAARYHKVVVGAEERFDQIFDEIAARLKVLKSPLAEALLNSKRHDTEYRREDGTLEIRPTVNLTPDLAQAITNWNNKSLSEWEIEGIDVTHSRVENPWHIVSDAHPTSFPCFNKEAYAQKESKKWSMDPAVKAVLKAKGLAIVEIERPWLDLNLLAHPYQLRKNGPHTLDTFFGPGGSLASVPVALVVVYKPSLSVSANTELYESTNQAWAQGKVDSFSFLGTHFKLDGGRKKFGTIVNQTHNTTVFNIGEDDGIATCSVVGVLSKTFYNGLPETPSPLSFPSPVTTTTTISAVTSPKIERPLPLKRFTQVVISNQAYSKLINITPAARGNKIWTISLHLPNYGPEEALETMRLEWEAVEKHLAETFLYLVTNEITPPDSVDATKLLATHPFAGTALLETFSFAIKDLDANSSSSTINPSSASVVSANVKHCLLRAIPHWSEKDLDVSTRYSPLLSALLYETPARAVETIKEKFVAAYDDGSRIISSPSPDQVSLFGTVSSGRLTPTVAGSRSARSRTPRTPLALLLQEQEVAIPPSPPTTPKTASLISQTPKDLTTRTTEREVVSSKVVIAERDRRGRDYHDEEAALTARQSIRKLPATQDSALETKVTTTTVKTDKGRNLEEIVVKSSTVDGQINSQKDRAAVNITLEKDLHAGKTKVIKEEVVRAYAPRSDSESQEGLSEHRGQRHRHHRGGRQTSTKDNQVHTDSDVFEHEGSGKEYDSGKGEEDGYKIITHEDTRRIVDNGKDSAEDDREVEVFPPSRHRTRFFSTGSKAADLNVHQDSSPNQATEIEYSRAAQITQNDKRNKFNSQPITTRVAFKVDPEPASPYGVKHLRYEIPRPDSASTADERVVLVQDIFAKARSGYTPTSEFLSLFQTLLHTSSASKASAQSHLVYLELAEALDLIRACWWEQPNIARGLKELLRKTFGGIAKELGFEAREGEDISKTKMRVVVLEAAAEGEDKEVIREMQERFSSLFSASSPASSSSSISSAIPADLRNVIYTIAVRHGSRSEWEAMLRLYQSRSSANNRDKTAALVALAATRVQELQHKVMQMIVNEEIPPLDMFQLLRGLRNNPTTQRRVWEFVKENYDVIAKRFEGTYYLGRTINGSVAGLSSKRDATDIKEFFQSKDTSTFKTSLEQALDGIIDRAAWVERDSEDVKDWLKLAGYVR